jgi:cytochrome c peroxidase
LVALLGWLSLCTAERPKNRVTFTDDDMQRILSHGPWPPDIAPDPSNRVSGQAAAIDLGRRLFNDPRLSLQRNRSCATCHDPKRHLTDGLARSIGIDRLDRNAPSLFNLRLNRWFGWAGKSDNLWAQSLHPIVDRRELGASADLVAQCLTDAPELSASYVQVFGSQVTADTPETQS